MENGKVFLITYKGKDKESWLKYKKILQYRNRKNASTFLDLRDVYQSKGAHSEQLQSNGVRFAKLGKMNY